jgi:hypothetical protein
MNELDNIDLAYDQMEVAASSGWSVSSVHWGNLGTYHAALKSFETSICLHALDDEWGPFLAFCRRYRFLLASTPLPPGVIVGQMMKWRINQGVHLDRLKNTLDPSLGRLYETLLTAFSGLQTDASSPLWQAAKHDLLETWESDAEIAVLCADSRLLSTLQDYISKELEGIGKCWVLKPSELKPCYMYDEFLAFGPTKRQFFDGSEFVYTAPRATSLRLYTPQIFKASVPTPYQFSGSPHHTHGSCRSSGVHSFAKPKNRSIGEAHVTATENGSEHDEEWLASLPLLVLPSKPFEDHATGAQWGDELFSAKQILLSADHAAFLLADGVIYRVGRERDPETGTDVCSGVEYVDVGDLGPGDIVLFQEHGGGSMVAEVANEIMGERTSEFRSAQAAWKDALISMVRSKDTYVITRMLRAKGASIKTVATVRNWCLPENIGPGSWRNFELLLQLLDLDNQREKIFMATQAIRTAHRSAGFKLAGRLLDMMGGKSLDQLAKEGRQEFGGIPGMPNLKVAYEIVAILPQEAEVGAGQINHPFAIK